MKESLRTGVSFGLTSGIITTLGLMVGLYAGTRSKLAVIGGILTIAVADAFSDALGIHISEEAENVHTAKQIWMATVATLLSKLVFALTFLVPVVLLELKTAIIVSIVWGIGVLAVFSYRMAIGQRQSPWKVTGEHLLVAVAVVVITNFVGEWISSVFGGG